MAEIVHFEEAEIVADFLKVVDMVMAFAVAAFVKTGLIVIDIHQIVFVAVDVAEIGIEFEMVHIVGSYMVEIVEIKVDMH